MTFVTEIKDIITKHDDYDINIICKCYTDNDILTFYKSYNKYIVKNILNNFKNEKCGKIWDVYLRSDECGWKDGDLNLCIGCLTMRRFITKGILKNCDFMTSKGKFGLVLMDYDDWTGYNFLGGSKDILYTSNKNENYIFQSLILNIFLNIENYTFSYICSNQIYLLGMKRLDIWNTDSIYYDSENKVMNTLYIISIIQQLIYISIKLEEIRYVIPNPDIKNIALLDIPYKRKRGELNHPFRLSITPSSEDSCVIYGKRYGYNGEECNLSEHNSVNSKDQFMKLTTCLLKHDMMKRSILHSFESIDKYKSILSNEFERIYNIYNKIIYTKIDNKYLSLNYSIYQKYIIFTDEQI